MPSSISTIFKRLNSTLQANSQTFSRNEFIFSCSRSYSTGKQSSKPTLYSKISPLGDPNLSLFPVLDKWVKNGKKVDYHELRRIVHDLRGRKRNGHALEVSEWMSSKCLCSFAAGDRAVQLDLIGRVRGLDAAESYFNNMMEEDKIDKLYGALLNCYVREGLVDKSLSLVQKMKEMGFALSPLVYNDLMCLYTNIGQLEKLPGVLSEMKDNGVLPGNFSYRICINSYGARSDLNGMKQVLEEMESQPHISMDWNTYASVANFYVKAGLSEEALIFLKKSEETQDQSTDCYNQLISHYASLGNKAEVMRLWGLEKANCKKQINKDYITMLRSLVKLGELEECENLLKEWESSCLYYDFRVPNVLLIGYSQKGLIEKAEATLRDIVNKGKTPTPNSWEIVAAGYLDKQNMEKAMECMKEAFAMLAENKGWRPKPRVILSILNWLCDNGKVEEAEAFANSLTTVFPRDRDVYQALIEENISECKEVHRILNSVLIKIDENETTEKLLPCKQEEPNESIGGLLQLDMWISKIWKRLWSA